MRNALGAKVRTSPFAREIDKDLESLRDDTIALFINSGLKQKDIHAAGGPTPGTISKWLYKETMFPRYSTISSFARALGCKLALVNKEVQLSQEERSNIAWKGKRRPKMPPKKTRKK